MTGLLIAPVVIVVTQLLDPGGSRGVATFAPAILGLQIGVSMAQDLCYDGTAIWLHICAGVSGAADRWGRVLSTLTVFSPIAVALTAVVFLATDRWALLAPVAGLTICLSLVGLGVGSYLGALWQWPRLHREPTPSSAATAAGCRPCCPWVRPC